MAPFLSSVDYPDLLNALSIVLNVGAIFQDKWLHEEAKKVSHTQHLEQVNTERMCSLQAIETELRAQIQSLGTDMTLAGKEAERDMWEQRNTQFQTLMLAATVMFGGGLGVITQGVMPGDVPRAYLILYSLSVALGFGLLFISIISSMAILKRMCKYMYCRARNHRVNFHHTLDKAMNMVEAFDRHKHNLRQEIHPLPYGADLADSITNEYGVFINDMIKQIRSARERENLSPPPPPHHHHHHHLWQRHTRRQRRLLSEAETSSMSFPDFWDAYCKHPGSLATNSFYAGTLALLISVTTMTSSILAFQLNSYISAIIFAGICVLCSTFAFAYYVRISDARELPTPPGWLLIQRRLTSSSSSSSSSSWAAAASPTAAAAAATAPSGGGGGDDGDETDRLARMAEEGTILAPPPCPPRFGGGGDGGGGGSGGGGGEHHHHHHHRHVGFGEGWRVNDGVSSYDLTNGQ